MHAIPPLHAVDGHEPRIYFCHAISADIKDWTRCIFGSPRRHLKAVCEFCPVALHVQNDRSKWGRLSCEASYILKRHRLQLARYCLAGSDGVWPRGRAAGRVSMLSPRTTQCRTPLENHPGPPFPNTR
eukprot:5474030-Pyramimonas_sp.AAC.1